MYGLLKPLYENIRDITGYRQTSPGFTFYKELKRVKTVQTQAR
jgi:hypothetical protein